jgi:hypothetical protein
MNHALAASDICFETSETERSISQLESWLSNVFVITEEVERDGFGTESKTNFTEGSPLLLGLSSLAGIPRHVVSCYAAPAWWLPRNSLDGRTAAPARAEFKNIQEVPLNGRVSQGLIQGGLHVSRSEIFPRC